MTDMLEEKSKALAQETGWTLEQAQGYVDGETFRQRGLELPPHHKIGMGEYDKDFRTSYYKQACSI